MIRASDEPRPFRWREAHGYPPAVLNRAWSGHLERHQAVGVFCRPFRTTPCRPWLDDSRSSYPAKENHHVRGRRPAPQPYRQTRGHNWPRSPSRAPLAELASGALFNAQVMVERRSANRGKAFPIGGDVATIPGRTRIAATNSCSSGAWQLSAASASGKDGPLRRSNDPGCLSSLEPLRISPFLGE